jgi:hypothetical protein
MPKFVAFLQHCGLMATHWRSGWRDGSAGRETRISILPMTSQVIDWSTWPLHGDDEAYRLSMP